MKLIYNNIMPFKGFKAMILFGFCFLRKCMIMSETDPNHVSTRSVHVSVLCV